MSIQIVWLLLKIILYRKEKFSNLKNDNSELSRKPGINSAVIYFVLIEPEAKPEWK